MYSKDLLVAALSGGVLVGVEKLMYKGEGAFLSMKSGKKFLVQGLSSYVAPPVTAMVSRSIIPDSIRKNIPAVAANSLVVGGIYTLATYFMKSDESSALKRFLISAGSDYVARWSYDMFMPGYASAPAIAAAAAGAMSAARDMAFEGSDRKVALAGTPQQYVRND